MSSIHSAILAAPVDDRDHAQGLATAPATLLEYGDFECPFCGQAYPIVKAVQQRLGSKLRFVFRHFPLSTAHPHAEMAAEAAEAAGAQGSFWAMHDVLYENQEHLNVADLVRYSVRLGLNVPLLAGRIAQGTYTPRVREDFLSGVRSGVNGTPSFFINGIRHDGAWDSQTLLAALMQAIA